MSCEYLFTILQNLSLFSPQIQVISQSLQGDSTLVLSLYTLKNLTNFPAEYGLLFFTSMGRSESFYYTQYDAQTYK